MINQMVIGGPELRTQQALAIPKQLADFLLYAKDNVPAYKRYPHANSLLSMEDFQKLPTINGDQLAQSPEDFKSKQSDIFRISFSGGTTDSPKILYRTYEDHLFSSSVAAEMFKTSTISSNDIVAILQPFDVWGIAFIGLEALRHLQATGLPIGSALTDIQCIQWLKEFDANIVYATPSRASTIADLFYEIQPNERNWSPRAFLLAGEPITNDIRSKLQEAFKAEIFSIYGSEETDGLASECSCHAGLHLVERGIIYELIDTKTLSPTDSYTGRLVVTPLGLRGTVLLRYAMDDIVELDFTPCECGKTSPRITKIQRRSQGLYLWDALYISEVQINSAIQKVFGEICPYQCIIEGTKPPQTLLVLVDPQKESTPLENMASKLRDIITNSSFNLANACNSGEVHIVVQCTHRNKFRKTKRGKIPQFISEES